jgi:hypothetical protein
LCLDGGDTLQVGIVPRICRAAWCLHSPMAMTDSLHSEVLVPTHSHLKRTLLAALGCGALGAAMSVVMVPAPPSVRVLTLQPEAENAAVPVTLPAAVEIVSEPVRSSALALVFSAGGATYMQLAALDGEDAALPAHGKVRLVNDDYLYAAIASVKPGDMPEAYRAWAGKRVTVDNTCETTVTGFAIVSRLTGDTGYAGVDADTWTASNVLDEGSRVLAAKLGGCTGTYARDAALPAVIVPDQVQNAELAAAARAALIASRPARDAQLEWLEVEQTGEWHEHELAKLDTRVVRHPTTGVTWVSVHGSMEHGCGDPEINVWGLFRVQQDGTLAAVQLRKLGDLWSIDHLIDIDNDGELELVGKPWLGLDTVVVRGSGEELERLSLAFFGCPC